MKVAISDTVATSDSVAAWVAVRGWDWLGVGTRVAVIVGAIEMVDVVLGFVTVAVLVQPTQFQVGSLAARSTGVPSSCVLPQPWGRSSPCDVKVEEEYAVVVGPNWLCSKTSWLPTSVTVAVPANVTTSAPLEMER